MTKQDEKQLVPATTAEVVKDLALPDPKSIQPENAGTLEANAESFVRQLLDLDVANVAAKQTGKDSVEALGLDLQREAAQQSELLKRPLADLSHRAEDGGEVANSLINLKVEVEKLDPAQLNLEPGWFSRMLGGIPGVGTPIKRYFSKYESAQTVIAAIIRSMELGKDQLGRDNITLREDQKRMAETATRLARAIQVGQLIDQKLQYQLDRELTPGSEKHQFVAEELMFPLRQRIMDLQQQLAVSQQGIVATELIIRNNQELIRGVNRALNVTVSALQVAVTVAVALGNQKMVLDKITAVSKTTSDLIAGTAARLKTQGVEIHKQASSTQISIDSLKSAFADLKTALNDISQFRVQALPQMASTILELDKMSADVKATIDKMELGNAKKPEIEVKVD